MDKTQIQVPLSVLTLMTVWQYSEWVQGNQDGANFYNKVLYFWEFEDVQKSSYAMNTINSSLTV